MNLNPTKKRPAYKKGGLPPIEESKKGASAPKKVGSLNSLASRGTLLTFSKAGSKQVAEQTPASAQASAQELLDPMNTMHIQDSSSREARA